MFVILRKAFLMAGQILRLKTLGKGKWEDGEAERKRKLKARKRKMLN